ncbi:MAG TPA: hypothetical protein VG937_32550 [Polyangiaceae bacterium]|nr:hypothetical protein [Polyangiaceae bacterium]
MPLRASIQAGLGFAELSELSAFPMLMAVFCRSLTWIVLGSQPTIGVCRRFVDRGGEGVSLGG